MLGWEIILKASSKADISARDIGEDVALYALSTEQLLRPRRRACFLHGSHSVCFRIFVLNLNFKILIEN